MRHLRPSAPIAPDVLLPGDPARALAIAQELLVAPRMSNHSRGLWGYGGETAQGRPLSVQATGIGGPSAAVVLEELVGHGARRVIRIGACESLAASPALGELVLATGAVASDGVSSALGSDPAPTADRRLTEALRSVAPTDARTAIVAGADLFYDPGREQRRSDWRAAGATVSDLATAPLLALARRLGIAAASALVVSGDPGGAALADDDRDAAALMLARIAARALAVAREGGGDQPLSVSGTASPL
jgi:uridine phosphorylase